VEAAASHRAVSRVADPQLGLVDFLLGVKMKSNFESGSELHLELSNLPIVRTFMILKKPYWVSLHTVKFEAFMNSMNDIYIYIPSNWEPS